MTVEEVACTEFDNFVALGLRGFLVGGLVGGVGVSAGESEGERRELMSIMSACAPTLIEVQVVKRGRGSSGSDVFRPRPLSPDSWGFRICLPAFPINFSSE